MKTGAIIPHRNDRPRFLAHLKYMLSQQTVQIDELYFVDEPPRSEAKDITYRYRKGYDYFRNKGFDVLFLIEVDDYYSPVYVQQQLQEWSAAGKPDLFGMRETEYYHIGAFAHFTFHHEQRSSAMSTLIKPDLNFDWCADNFEYTDVHLFSKLQYKLWLPRPIISIGIKHGSTLTGGECHRDDLNMYRQRDPDKKWLQATTDPVSFQFYSTFFSADTTKHNLPK